MSGNRIIYWDSCIFISYIKGEIRADPGDMKGIEEQVLKIDSGQINLVTSAITLTEVLRTCIPEEAYLEFRKIFSRYNISLLDVTKDVAELAHEIRCFYYHEKQPTVSVPDCIHIASAIYWNCKTLYTFDGESTKRKGILDLPSPIAGKYAIEITKPHPNNEIEKNDIASSQTQFNFDFLDSEK